MVTVFEEIVLVRQNYILLHYETPGYVASIKLKGGT